MPDTSTHVLSTTITNSGAVIAMCSCGWIGSTYLSCGALVCQLEVAYARAVTEYVAHVIH
jgi:hypothetical protein